MQQDDKDRRPAPARQYESAFEWIGGEPAVQVPVDRFTTPMDLEPDYRELRAEATAARSTRRARSWHSGSCAAGSAGPTTISRSAPAAAARHMPFSIGIQERPVGRPHGPGHGRPAVPEGPRVQLQTSFATRRLDEGTDVV